MDFNIEFTSSHPSVSKSCVGVDCPFCGDLKKHVGVFLNSEGFSCWKCGRAGHLFTLIKEIKDITWKEYCEVTGREDIPEGDEDLYILKSQVVPPVCPKWPDVAACPRPKPCPPCPPCGRCPEPAFRCKKVPNYTSRNQTELPLPMLNTFSAFR